MFVAGGMRHIDPCISLIVPL